MKYITIKLTEDQARDLVSLIDGWLPSSRWYLGEWEKLNSILPEEHPEERYRKTRDKVAFRERVAIKIRQEIARVS